MNKVDNLDFFSFTSFTEATKSRLPELFSPNVVLQRYMKLEEEAAVVMHMFRNDESFILHLIKHMKELDCDNAIDFLNLTQEVSTEQSFM